MGTHIDVSLLDDELIIDVDAMRLQQIIFNLLNNAKQSLEVNGSIDVSLKREADQLAITIKDTGIGIPKEEQNLIFERFYRGEGKKFKVRGLGLGLPFSKMIAKALGGDLILVESTPNGSTFKILLPINSKKCLML